MGFLGYDSWIIRSGGSYLSVAIKLANEGYRGKISISRNERRNYKVYTGSELREFTSMYITRFLPRERDHAEKQDQLRKLKDSSLTLIGLGSIGSHVLYSLAPLGIGKMRIIDHHTVNPEDVKLGFFRNEDLGKQQCTVYQRIFHQFMNQTSFEWYPFEVTSMTVDAILGDSDLVVLCSDQSQPLLHNYVNEICLKHNRTWLSARFCGYYGEVGPNVIPYKTPCYKCYECRVKSNMDDMSDMTRFERHPQHVKENYGSFGIFMRMIAEYTSLEIIKTLTKCETPTTVGTVLSIDFENYTNTLHRVLKVPYCPACGRGYRKHEEVFNE